MRSGNGAATRAAGVVASCVLAALASCAPGSDLPVLPPVEPGPYRLGIGDRIRVITTGAEEATADFRVGAEGGIAVPLRGRVPAAGLSADQLAGEITHDFEARHLFRNPNVVVEIMEYRPIDILGEVNRPGEYPYRPGDTMLSAVAVSGGFTYRAITGYAGIVRQTGPDKTAQGKIGRGDFIQPGDVITIYERRF